MFDTDYSREVKTVYFIRPVGMQGPIKIGCSQSPDGRRSTLETWSPFALEIAAEIEGTHKTERQFHGLFWEDHERREWFRWSPELQAVIDQITAGTFDVSTLPPPRHLPFDHVRRSKVQRAAWTPQRRLEQSLTMRAYQTLWRTGLACPANVCAVWSNLDERAKVEAYLADPQTHGVAPRGWQIESLDKARARAVPQ